MFYSRAVKYAPNPDWLSLRPWAHKFRKARWEVSKGKGLCQANRQPEHRLHRTDAASSPCPGFSCTSDTPLWSINCAMLTLWWALLGTHFLVLLRLLLKEFVDLMSHSGMFTSQMKRTQASPLRWSVSCERPGWVIFICTPDKSLARMRELCKGLYSSSYEDSINSKVKLLTRAINLCNPHPCLLWQGLFSDEKNLQGHPPPLSETNNRVDTVVLDTLEDPTIAETRLCFPTWKTLLFKGGRKAASWALFCPPWHQPKVLWIHTFVNTLLCLSQFLPSISAF